MPNKSMSKVMSGVDEAAQALKVREATKRNAAYEEARIAKLKKTGEYREPMDYKVESEQKLKADRNRRTKDKIMNTRTIPRDFPKTAGDRLGELQILRKKVLKEKPDPKNNYDPSMQLQSIDHEIARLSRPPKD